MTICVFWRQLILFATIHYFYRQSFCLTPLHCFYTIIKYFSNISDIRYPGFDPITFTISENSNYGGESLLEVWRQNFAGHCQQSFENKKFVDITQQCFALLPLVNLPPNNLNFNWRWRWWDQIKAIFLNLFYFYDQ